MQVSIEFIKPSPALTPFIRYYLFTDIATTDNLSGDVNYKLVVIPDGEVELHIGYHDTTSSFSFYNEPAQEIRSAVVGVNSLTKAMTITSLKRRHKCIVVKFSNCGFNKIFGLPLSITFNKIAEAESILGSNINTLFSQIDHASDHKARVELLEGFFLRQASFSNRKSKQRLERVASAIEIINRYQGKITLPELINGMSISERPLQRDFNEVSGVSPIQFCKMIRFMNLLNSMEMQTNMAICSDLVFYHGYFDQAHLIHDFKKATTLTPRSYRRRINSSIYRAFNTIIIPDRECPEPVVSRQIIATAANSYSKFLS